MPLSSYRLCEAEIITPISARIVAGEHRRPPASASGRARATSIPTEVKARDQSGFDHVAGQAGILADDHAVTVIAALKQKTRRLADLERQLRRDLAIGAAANASVPRMLANHDAGNPPEIVTHHTPSALELALPPSAGAAIH
jgi:hypothetical protein